MADLRTKLWTRFGRARRRRLSRVTAIDIDRRTLRVAEVVRRRGRVSVVRLAAEPIPNGDRSLDRDDPEAVGRWMRETLARLGFEPSVVVFSVPRRHVVLRALALPAVEEASDLASMVQFQIGKDLPFGLEDAVLDFAVQENANREAKPHRGESTVLSGAPPVGVLAAVVRRELVEQRQAEAAAAGLKLVALGLRSHANVCCAELCEKPGGEKGVALISLRGGELYIDVLIAGTLAFSHSAALASGAIHEDAPSGDASSALAPNVVEPDTSSLGGDRLDTIALEVSRSLGSFEGLQERGRVAKVLVAGDTGVEPDVVRRLRSRLDIPCELFDPSDALRLQGDDRALAPASIAVIGLAAGALDPSGLAFDFLHPKKPVVRRDPRVLRRLAVAALAVAAVIVVLIVRARLIGDRQTRRDALHSQIMSQQAQDAIHGATLARAGIVGGWEASARPWLDHWVYLSAVLPPASDAYVTSLSTRADGSIHLGLQARDAPVLSAIYEGLRAAGYQNVSPMPQTPQPDRFGYRFRSTVSMLAPFDMALELETTRPPERPEDDGSLDASLWKPATSASASAPSAAVVGAPVEIRPIEIREVSR